MLRNLLSNAGLILGTIFPYYKEDEPTNFLICNGQSCVGYEIEDIGITKVPDLRGKFTRMIGGNSLGIGIEQGDCIRNIQGSINTDTYDDKGYSIYNQSITTYPDGVIRNGSKKRNWSGFQIAKSSGNHETSDLVFDASFVVPTGPENRPINMAFNYIIYVGRKKTHELISLIKSLFNNEVMIYA